jgi:hypothetical protein
MAPTTTFQIGDLIRHECKYLGLWQGEVIEVFHFDDGAVTYETLGRWVRDADGTPRETTGKRPTLKRLGARHMTLQSATANEGETCTDCGAFRPKADGTAHADGWVCSDCTHDRKVVARS